MFKNMNKDASDKDYKGKKHLNTCMQNSLIVSREQNTLSICLEHANNRTKNSAVE